MIQNKKGFTLIELLIAATIIGILAVFATVAYRSSAADTRVAGAKSKLDVLATAVQRYKLDPAACPGIASSATLTVANLVNCGYLERSLFSVESDEYFTFQICGSSSSSLCSGSTYLACMSGNSSKLPKRYLSSSGYKYCIDTVGKPSETMGAN